MTFLACSKGPAHTWAPVIITGDTLFIGSCGRYDLPDSNVREMLMSLEKLSALPTDCIVCPGHNYAQPSKTTIGQEKLTNLMMQQAMEVGPQLRNQELPRKGGGGGNNSEGSIKKNQTSSDSGGGGGDGGGDGGGTGSSNSNSRSSAMASFVPLPDYLGVARGLLKSHVEWDVVHATLRCEECRNNLTFDGDSLGSYSQKAYEPRESLL